MSLQGASHSSKLIFFTVELKAQRQLLIAMVKNLARYLQEGYHSFAGKGARI